MFAEIFFDHCIGPPAHLRKSRVFRLAVGKRCLGRHELSQKVEGSDKSPQGPLFQDIPKKTDVVHVCLRTKNYLEINSSLGNMVDRPTYWMVRTFGGYVWNDRMRMAGGKTT